MTIDVPALLPHVLLRQQTRVEHIRVEATGVMRDLFDDRLDAASYAQLLCGYRDLYLAWEGHHASWLHDLALVGWIYQSRLPALEQDLQAFGSVSTSPARPGDAQDSAAAWGALYVIEGSLLGGQVIARQLARRFPAQGHRFFNLGADRSGNTWKNFQELIDGALASSGDVRAAVSQAKAMFALFQDMFEALPAKDHGTVITQAGAL